MNIADLYQQRKESPLLNTSYPLSPADWLPYKQENMLDFSTDSEYSFYLHIPFCPHLCTYCEYTRMRLPSEQWQRHYLNVVYHDIMKFRATHPHFTLQGFDIGGGTPTALPTHLFNNLLTIYDEAIKGLIFAKDYEPSIEGTVDTLSDDKLKSIANHGIRRVSLGIQSTSAHILKAHHRHENTVETISHVIENAHQNGIRKVNLDLMYGLRNQTHRSIATDMDIIDRLRPEQVTLYELRTNMLHRQPYHTHDWLFHAYQLMYERLTDMGYHATFGQNTFSRSTSDHGLSSYLRHRMLNGESYRGFGLSAQSMSREGVSYNRGKNSSQLSAVLQTDTFEPGDVYRLPPHERCAKYIAIAAYGGGFSLRNASRLLQSDASQYFHTQIDFCLDKGLLTLTDSDNLHITPKGFRHYGAVFSLFYLPQL